MRKEFEEFMFNFLGVNVSGNKGITLSGHDGYVFEDDDSTMVCTVAWLSWKASREAMKPIKLPVKMKNTEAAECYYYNDAIDECKEAIEQAGYKAE